MTTMDSHLLSGLFQTQVASISLTGNSQGAQPSALRAQKPCCTVSLTLGKGHFLSQRPSHPGTQIGTTGSPPLAVRVLSDTGDGHGALLAGT